MAALGAQSIASSYEQLLHVDRDGGGNTTTHVSVKDGDNGTTFGFTIATDALMMSSTNRLEFGDTGTYIFQSADGVLDLVSDTEIEINATTIDVNGALDLSGNAQLSGTVTVGADGSGTDVIFYSGTAGDNFTWDASEEKLTITGTNAATALDVADGNVTIADDLAVDGTANLDEVDIDGAVQIDNTITVGADDQGYDVIFYGDTASSNMTWDTSEDDLVLNDATLKIDQDDDASSFTIDSEATSATVINLNGMASTTGKIINIDDCDALTTGSALHINSNSSSTGTRNLVEIVNNHASATGAVNLFLDQNANNEALFIDAENTTIGAVDIHCDTLTTGRVARFYSDSSDNSTRNLVEITNDNVSADNAVGLLIQQDGADASIELTGNGGIKFPGTQGASADANTLDDYEEGTWTPVFSGTGGTSGQAYGVQKGVYTKIGQLVVASFYLTLSDKGTITTILQLSGFPFAASSVSNVHAAAALGRVEAWTLNADHVLSLHMNNDATTAYFTQYEGTGSSDSGDSVTTSHVNDTTSLMGTMSYIV